MRAFTDTWEWNTDSRAAYEEVVESGGRAADTMRAFRTMLDGSDMLAYLSMMAPRLIELHRVMKPTATLYLHCDPTADKQTGKLVGRPEIVTRGFVHGNESDPAIEAPVLDLHPELAVDRDEALGVGQRQHELQLLRPPCPETCARLIVW